MTSPLADKTAPGVQPETLSKGERTRQKLMDLAYDALIRKGFAATSIEELVEPPASPRAASSITSRTSSTSPAR
jgi:hypothetical protein